VVPGQKPFRVSTAKLLNMLKASCCVLPVSAAVRFELGSGGSPPATNTTTKRAVSSSTSDTAEPVKSPETPPYDDLRDVVVALCILLGLLLLALVVITAFYFSARREKQRKRVLGGGSGGSGDGGDGGRGRRDGSSVRVQGQTPRTEVKTSWQRVADFMTPKRFRVVDEEAATLPRPGGVYGTPVKVYVGRGCACGRVYGQGGRVLPGGSRGRPRVSSNVNDPLFWCYESDAE
jgi:hypothetical protein